MSFFHACVDPRCLAAEWGWHWVKRTTPIRWACQSPLCPRAKGNFANSCTHIACALKTQCNRRLAPSSFITVIKWLDRNAVGCFDCFYSLVQNNTTVKAFLTCKWLHLDSGFSCWVHDDKLCQLSQIKDDDDNNGNQHNYEEENKVDYTIRPW